jgi:thiol-disulfide isomerase/thioredoxin
VATWKSTPSNTDLPAQQIYAASFPDLAGKAQPLANWRGKVLVLNFWATWCPPCRQEIPDFVAVANAYRGKDLAIVGIALDERDPVVAFAKEFGIGYPMLLGGDAGYGFAEQLGNRSSSIPFTVIIDRQGQVAYVALGAVRRAELEKQVDKLL